MITVIIAIPFMGILTVIGWNLIAISGLSGTLLYLAVAGCVIAFAVQVYMTYMELENSESEGLGKIGFSIKQLVRQYLKSSLMPVIPHVGFHKQTLKVITKNED
ncbi:hypothetical protein F7Q91_02985 [Vibrio chagasii]|uniref:Uncharacterized protein n=1 Tax=Vibrio chagasii TaxID=170679 RepID=A0A7V7THZ9_9VIBR|nr:hypothetical protein [Vibrio chagasii]KAB0482386.1 hypothetical protein F7Q91_02985 [Vibrio chagasii]